jgi:hypothetical protein
MFGPAKYTRSPWLKGADLKPGKRTIVTILKAFEQTFPSGDTQPVLELLELDQRLPLNKTRVRKLVGLFGNDVEGWIGQRISLYAVAVSFNGKPTSSVAIGPAPRKQPVKPAEDDHADMIVDHR